MIFLKKLERSNSINSVDLGILDYIPSTDKQAVFLMKSKMIVILKFIIPSNVQPLQRKTTIGTYLKIKTLNLRCGKIGVIQRIVL